MKALVTGGGGFLGKAIVSRLIAGGNEVISFARGDYPELCRRGAEVAAGDIADAGAVVSVASGCDVVFQVAARVGIWGQYREYYYTNVKGTENVIEACRAHRIRRLVYTSSPSVVFCGGDMEGLDESVAYPETYHAHYPKTKAMAERMVLKADGEERR